MGGSDSKEPEVKESKGEDADRIAEENDKHKNVKLTKRDKEDMEKFKVNSAELDDGPISNRKCTDCLFAVVFIAAVGAMFCAAIYGWSQGKPDQLLIGWDSDQNGCGFSDKTADYPLLYWPQMPDSSMIK